MTMRETCRAKVESGGGLARLTGQMLRLLTMLALWQGDGLAHAVVQVLPDMVLTREGRTISGAKAVQADPTVKEVLTAFTRAEQALERQEDRKSVV